MFRSRRASQTTRRAADGSLMKGVDRLGGKGWLTMTGIGVEGNDAKSQPASQTRAPALGLNGAGEQ